jgi:hypothetical protein
MHQTCGREASHGPLPGGYVRLAGKHITGREKAQERTKGDDNNRRVALGAQ